MQDNICLHSCCAPCSSYCLLALSADHEVTVFYDNPNITDETEYRKRAAEQKRLIEELNLFSKWASDPENAAYAGRVLPRLKRIRQAAVQRPKHASLYDWIRDRLSLVRYPIAFAEGTYRPERFWELAKGLESEPERGKRCQGCYGLRLSDTASFAREKGGFTGFATTLTLSPLKDAKAINEIGGRIAKSAGIPYLETEFKKKNGYLLSILLSEVFELYRQSYCGCLYSRDADVTESNKSKGVTEDE